MMTSKKQALLLAVLGIFLVAFAVLVGFFAIQKLVRPPAPPPKPPEEVEEEVEVPEVFVQEAQETQTFSLNRYAQKDFYLPFVPGLEACSGQAECQFSARIESSTPVTAEINSSDGNVAWGYTAQPTPATKLYIPRLMKKYYNNWNSGIVIQNTSGNQATGKITFYNTDGGKVTDQSFTIGANTYQSFYVPDISGLPACSVVTECQFSAIITSNVPVTAEVNSTDGNVAWAYTAEPTAATKLYLPRVMKNYHGWNSGIAIQNAGDRTAYGRISFYKPDGTLAATKTFNNLKGHSQRTFYLPSILNPAGTQPLLADGVYSAIIKGNYNNEELTAEINSTDGNMAWGYTAQPTAATKVYLPRILKNAYPQSDGRNWDSGIIVQNASGRWANNVGLVIHDSNGNPAETKLFNIAPQGQASFYVPDLGISDGQFSAMVSTRGEEIVVEVNTAEFNRNNQPLRGWGYTGQPTASQTLYLPRLLKNYYNNWQSGIVVQNPTAGGLSANIAFYNSWKCVGGDVAPCVQDPLGKYPSKSDCEASCKWCCNQNNYRCYQSDGCTLELDDCRSACAAPTSTPTPTPTPRPTPTPTPTPRPTSTPTPTPTPQLGMACQIDFSLPTGTPTPTPTPTPSFACLDLGPSPSEPQPGDELTFTCRGSALNIEIDHYNFQTLDESDAAIDSHTENTSATEASYAFTVPEGGGTFKVQCQVCADLGGSEGVVCTQWGQAR